MKLYWNDRARLCIAFAENQPETDVDDVVPAELRHGSATGLKERIEKFFFTLQLWLTDAKAYGRMQQAAAKGTKKNPVHFQLPPPNLKTVGIIAADGTVDHDRARALVGLVAKRWREKSQPGLLHGLIKNGVPIDQIDKSLDAFPTPEAFRKGPDNPIDRFLWIIAGADLFPEREFLGEAEFNWIFGWLRSVPKSHPAYKDHNNWIMDLSQLGICDPVAQTLNEPRLDTIIAYMKDHEGDKPDYYKLLKHLRALDRANGVKSEAEGTNSDSVQATSGRFHRAYLASTNASPDGGKKDVRRARKAKRRGANAARKRNRRRK